MMMPGPFCRSGAAEENSHFFLTAGDFLLEKDSDMRYSIGGEGGCNMKFVIQRVTRASVTVDGSVTGQIGKGFLVLIGVADKDTTQDADKMIKKLLNLRIFEDSEGKTNLSLTDVGGSLLLVSQFTLYADCRKGNRPSFVKAGKPDFANEMYEYIIAQCRAAGFEVQTGSFGADMKVELLNDGPFTIVLDSGEL